MHAMTEHSRRAYLFGTLRVRDERGTRRISGRRSSTLLAYLLLHPQVPHRREVLADLLAPEAPPDRVLRALSDTLYRLRQDLGTTWLQVGPETIALRADAGLWVDAWEFDRLAAGRDAADLQGAIDLYTGDLLSDVDADWVLAEREARHARYLAALEAVAGLHETGGDLAEALIATRRLIAAEPLHEPAHQAYLRLLGRLRRFGEALAHYQFLRTLLRSELDATPMAETTALMEDLERERSLASTPVVVEERTRFVGRVAERAAALEAVEASLRGRGCILAIEGEPGIGKSRFLREIAAGARWRGATILAGAAGEVPGASPLAPLANALAPLLGGPRAAQVQSLLPGDVLAALAPLHPAWGQPATVPDEPADRSAQRFYNGLRVLGETLAQLTPVVLVQDDLHWADSATWKSLDAISQGLTDHGAILLVAYRRPEIERTAGWATLQAWDRAGRLRTIALQPLGVDDVADLVGAETPIDPAEVHALTGGSPFLIGDWLAEGSPAELLPNLMITRRLPALSPAARTALDAAAVLGLDVDYRTWGEVAGLASLELAVVSDELLARHWLDPSAAGVAFTHDLVRVAVYEAIDPAARRAAHTRAARAYRRLEPENLRARAFHLDRAGLAAEAAVAYRGAAEQDLARFALGEAQGALHRALELMPVAPTEERVEAAIALARVCHMTGDRVREEAALAEALAGARDRDPQLLLALLAGGKFSAHTGRLAEAQQRLETALAIARRLPDRTQEIEALISLGVLARERSHWGDANERYGEALRLARAAGDLRREAQALLGLGNTADDQGSPRDSIPLLEQAIAIYQRIGAQWRVATTRVSLAASLLTLGAFDRVLSISGEAMAVLTDQGDRPNAAVARHNLATAYNQTGDSALARQLLERNLAVFDAVQSRRALGVTRNVLGDVAAAEGDLELALSYHRLALADAVAIENLAGMAFARHDLGALLVRLGQPAEAIPLLVAAQAGWLEQENAWQQVRTEAHLALARLAVGERAQAEELASSGWASLEAGIPLGDGSLDWLWALHRLLAALGQEDRARVALRAAFGELQRRGQAIGDPARRRSFFERVALNRDVLAAHDELATQVRAVQVSLARRGVPLGRPLRPDELVSVRWTVDAAEDAAFTDSVALRTYRLERLLREADEQDAAPTDDDLARALGVSRRTILRDMQRMGADAPAPGTRRRPR
jgi:DNA-binding SARP family transcriptional activator/Tfp pilus assembly protein PilF